MPTIEDWFLADVLAHPGEDAPRLIYADWLDEQGREARAEFIRVQIEMARLDGECRCGWIGPPGRQCDACYRCAGLALRGRQLLNDPLAVSVPWGTEAAVESPLAWTHRRGFLASVRLVTEQWLRDGPLFVARCPLELVSLADCSPFYPRGDPRGGCMWFEFARRRTEDDPSVVSSQFWPHLRGGLSDYGTGTSRHPTREAALTALSVAALAWARAEALRTRHTPTVEIDSCHPPPAPVE